jgi:hypothetical protein
VPQQGSQLHDRCGSQSQMRVRRQGTQQVSQLGAERWGNSQSRQWLRREWVSQQAGHDGPHCGSGTASGTAAGFVGGGRTSSDRPRVDPRMRIAAPRNAWVFRMTLPHWLKLGSLWNHWRISRGCRTRNDLPILRFGILCRIHQKYRGEVDSRQETVDTRPSHHLFAHPIPCLWVSPAICTVSDIEARESW